MIWQLPPFLLSAEWDAVTQTAWTHPITTTARRTVGIMSIITTVAWTARKRVTTTVARVLLMNRDSTTQNNIMGVRTIKTLQKDEKSCVILCQEKTLDTLSKLLYDTQGGRHMTDYHAADKGL